MIVLAGRIGLQVAAPPLCVQLNTLTNSFCSASAVNTPGSTCGDKAGFVDPGTASDIIFYATKAL